VRVRFTPSGRSQFLAAIVYLRCENPAAAVVFRQKAEKVLLRLRRFPQSGRVLPEFPDLPFREAIITPYRLFYRVKGKTIWVVAVWHGAQLPKPLREIPDE
jgi:plasmid stabilization system protein ParE